MWRLHRLHLLIYSFLKITNTVIWLAESHTVLLNNDLSGKRSYRSLVPWRRELKNIYIYGKWNKIVPIIWVVTHATDVNRYCVTMQITKLKLIFVSTCKLSLLSPYISNRTRWETLISDHEQFRGFSKVFNRRATGFHR